MDIEKTLPEGLVRANTRGASPHTVVACRPIVKYRIRSNNAEIVLIPARVFGQAPDFLRPVPVGRAYMYRKSTNASRDIPRLLRKFGEYRRDVGRFTKTEPAPSDEFAPAVVTVVLRRILRASSALPGAECGGIHVVALSQL